MANYQSPALHIAGTVTTLPRRGSRDHWSLHTTSDISASSVSVILFYDNTNASCAREWKTITAKRGLDVHR